VGVVPQEHRDLHTIKTESLLVKSGEMALNDDMKEQLPPHQSILYPISANNFLLRLLHLMQEVEYYEDHGAGTEGGVVVVEWLLSCCPSFIFSSPWPKQVSPAVPVASGTYSLCALSR